MRDNYQQGGGRNDRRGPKSESKEEALRKMFVGGLPRDTSDDDLANYFSQFGELTDHIVIKDGMGQSKGFGFVTFKTDEQAEACIKQKTEGHMVNGKSVEVKRAIPRDAEPDQREKNTKMFLGGLSKDTNEETVKEYFETNFNCTVDSVDLIYEKKDQCEPGQEPKRRGFGFMTINDFDMVDHLCVVKIHNIDGKDVEVKKAAPKENNNRRQGGGGYNNNQGGSYGGRQGGYNQGGYNNNSYGGGNQGGYNQGYGNQGGYGGNQGGYNNQGGYGGNQGGYGGNQGGYDQSGGYGQQGGYNQGGYNQQQQPAGGYNSGYNQQQSGGGNYGGGYQGTNFSGPDKGGRGGYKQGGRGGYKPY